MKNGWTGAQYSIYRIVFGLYLFIHFFALVPWADEVFRQILPREASPLLYLFPNILAVTDVAIPLIVIAEAAAILFAIGFHDRVAAVIMWYVLACLFGRNPLIANPSLPFVGWLLLAHAFLPRAPFWSWEARGRVDPRGNWSMPPQIFAAAWMLMSLGYTYSGYTKLMSPSWTDGSAFSRVLANPLARPSFIRDLLVGLPPLALSTATWGALALELLYAPLALFRRVRPWLWLAMLLMHLGLMVLIDFADLSFGMVILHFFTFDPAWIRRRAPETTERVLYDGSCGLCHRSVRFLIAEDAAGSSFVYAPQEGGGATVVIETASGERLTHSTAVIHLMHRLGGLWRVMAIVFTLIPQVLRDAVYNFIARIRYRIFGRTREACPLMPPELLSRFTHS